MSRGTQRPIELSPMMLIAIAVVVWMGVIGFRGKRKRETEIVRFSGQPIEFTSLGVKISPTDGWTHLSVADHAWERRPTFVNESAYLIVRFHPFQFQSWPPGEDELSSKGMNTQAEESDDIDRPLAEAPIEHADYAQVSIDWIEVERHRTRGAGFLVGRLKAGKVDLMVTVMTHSNKADCDDSIQRLCDSIEISGSAESL